MVTNEELKNVENEESLEEKLEKISGGHAMGPNVSGVIGSAIDAGIVIDMLKEEDKK